MIPVFYTPKQVALEGSTSPSAAKPAAVVEAWQAAGFPIEIREPRPVTRSELALAHDRQFVDDVLDLHAPNGFGTVSAAVAESLPYTSGAMLDAARAALTSRSAACAPVSGFHHAGWDSPQGFCTFNGLVVAARVLRAEGVQRVGILDCDEHYGNGTDEIIRRLGLRSIEHWTAGAKIRAPAQAQAFLRSLPGIIARMYRNGCEVILYQAGADPHIDDPLGGFLTSAQLAERDRIVFKTCRDLRIGVAWNLAGGYRRDAAGTIAPVVETHVATMKACVEVYGR